MNKALGKGTTWGILLLCALIIVNGALSYRNLRTLRESMLRAEESRDALLAVERVFSLVKDVESGSRDFAVAGTQDYLDTFAAAEKAIPGELATVKRLLAERPDEAATVAELETNVRKRHEWGRNIISARRERGPEAAREMTLSGEGKRRMDTVRANVQDIRERELQNLAHWSEESEASYRTALISLLNATAGGLVLIGAIYYLMRRESIQRQQNEQLLRSSEARFRRLSDANVMGVLFADYDGKIHEANDSFLRMIGYTREDLAASPIDWIKLTPPEYADLDRRAIDELKATGVCTPFEKEYIRKDGSRIPCLIGCAQLEAPAGRAICYAIDLTERNRAAETIRNLNRELQHRVHELETLLELMPIGIAIAKDPECKEISTNPACAELLGLARGMNASLSASESQRPKNFQVLQNGLELAVNELPMQRAIASGQPVIAEEVEIVRNDGVTLKLLEYVAPLVHDDGRIRGGVGVFVDVTERTRLLEQLRGHAEYLENQQHWLQSLLDLLPVPLLLIEPQTGRVTFANRAAHEMADGSFPIGDTVENYEQLYYSTDLSGFRIPPERMPAMRVAKGERLERYELVWHLPQGARSLLINADSLPAMHGQQRVAVLIFQDITALKQVEAELRRTNQAKDALLAMLGHELRNPLAAITGSADVVATHSPEDPVYRTALDILKRHITHLTRLIDDMLDLARLTTGKIQLRLERVDLLQPLNHSLQAAQTQIEARGHTLLVDLPREPVYLRADRARLEQVFTNLLLNAAKYTDQGGRIELRTHVEDNHAVVSIRDNGIGIDPQVIPRLFDLFAQVKPTLDRSQAGLGIGLTVVRNLVDLHGGDVEANSEGVGKGSEFVVRLPLGSAQTTDKPAAPRPATKFLRTLKVLIVEDNPDIAQVLVALINRCGHDAIWAAAGPEALEAVSRAVPDIGLLDIGLPGMNGYELAIELKKNPRFDGVPLVALTGFGQQEDRVRSVEAGFVRHLVKPVSLETLEEVFYACIK